MCAERVWMKRSYRRVSVVIEDFLTCACQLYEVGVPADVKFYWVEGEGRWVYRWRRLGAIAVKRRSKGGLSFEEVVCPRELPENDPRPPDPFIRLDEALGIGKALSNAEARYGLESIELEEGTPVDAATGGPLAGGKIWLLYGC